MENNLTTLEEKIKKNNFELLLLKIELHEQMDLKLRKELELEKEKQKSLSVVSATNANMQAGAAESAPKFTIHKGAFVDPNANMQAGAAESAPKFTMHKGAFIDPKVVSNTKNDLATNAKDDLPADAKDHFKAGAKDDVLDFKQAEEIIKAADKAAEARDLALAIAINTAENAEVNGANAAFGPVCPNNGQVSPNNSYSLVVRTPKKHSPSPSPSNSPCNPNLPLVVGSFDTAYRIQSDFYKIQADFESETETEIEIDVDTIGNHTSDMSVIKKEIINGMGINDFRFHLLRTAVKGMEIIVFSPEYDDGTGTDYSYLDGYYDPRLRFIFSGNKPHFTNLPMFKKAISSVYPKLYFNYKKDTYRTVFVLYKSTDPFKKGEYEIYKVHTGITTTGESFITKESINEYTQWQIQNKIIDANPEQDY